MPTLPRVTIQTVPKKGLTKVFVLALVMISLTYFSIGFFVVQPIGAIPKGVTVLYWRLGTQFPFVTSVDSLLLEKMGGVSLLSRGLALGTLADPIIKRKIFSLPYSQTLYLLSTGGREFDR